MSTPLDSIGTSIRADAETLRVISQNVANAQSVAYRREISLPTSFEQALRLDQSAAAGSTLDLTPGTLQSTASPLHAAIEGPGFFIVDTSRGPALTRRGDFQLDSQGRLVTQAGDPVQGMSGALVIGADQPSIASDGSIHVGNDLVGQLRIVDVSSAAALQPIGNSTYAVADGEQTIDVPAPLVRQGFLETSNVQTVNEMVRLMEAMRHFEAGQRFIRGYDDMVDKAITTLGRI